MRRLSTATAIILLAAGCSAEQTPNTPTPTSSTSAAVTTSHTPAGPPPLRAVVEQFVKDSNDTIGENNTDLIRQYATTECANQVIGMFGETTNEASVTRVIDVVQNGTTGTATTAEEANPGSQGTIQWVYQDRWRFTCEGLFEVSIN